MPIYEYECSGCGKIVDVIQSNFSPPQSIRAECCKKPARKIISRPGQILIRGPGMEKFKGKNFAIQANEYVERMRGWGE